jgi:hypothetical protein
MAKISEIKKRIEKRANIELNNRNLLIETRRGSKMQEDCTAPVVQQEKSVQKLVKLTYTEMASMQDHQVHHSSSADIIKCPGGWLYMVKVPTGTKSFYADPVFVPYPVNNIW